MFVFLGTCLNSGISVLFQSELGKDTLTVTFMKCTGLQAESKIRLDYCHHDHIQYSTQQRQEGFFIDHMVRHRQVKIDN